MQNLQNLLEELEMKERSVRILRESILKQHKEVQEKVCQEKHTPFTVSRVDRLKVNCSDVKICNIEVSNLQFLPEYFYINEIGSCISPSKEQNPVHLF